MECYEKGLLSKKDLDGQDFRFGNSQAIIEAIRKIAFREGYGDLLAEGVKRVADRLGAHDFAMHVKGQETPAYDPRGLMGMGLAYATSNRGACHNRAWVVGLELYTDMDRFTTKGKAEVCKYVQDSTAIKDSLIMCHFLFSINNPALDFEWISRMLRALTGLTFSEKDLLLIGERIWNLGRIYNVLAGMRSEEDNLPKRLLREPLPSGVSRGRIVKLEEMLNEYYKVRKWDKETGLPRIQKMEELGMHEIVGVLKEKGYLCKE